MDAVVAVTDTCTVVCVACVYAERVGARVAEMLMWGWRRCGCGKCRACEWYTWFRYCV